MRWNRCSWASFFVVTLFVAGCATVTQQTPTQEKVSDNTPPLHVEAMVRPGGIMMEVARGDHFTNYRLDKELNGNLLLNSCKVLPQVFTSIYEDGSYFYALSATDEFYQFGPDRPGPPTMCGVKFSKDNLQVVSLVIGAPAASGQYYPMDINGDARPNLEALPMIDIYKPNYVQRIVSFESFSDDYLYLHYKEERGQRGGYDRQNKYVSVPPMVSERVFDFDLQASKTIHVQGATIEVVEARPDKLVYKVIEKMSAE